jgi:serine/threonine-protein kinase PknK
LPETGILLLSAHVEVEHAMELLGSGARTGYLLKGRVTDVEDFVESLERVARGGSIVDPGLVRELRSRTYAVANRPTFRSGRTPFRCSRQIRK